jgi:two-component system, NarL family, response regulator YdfI
MIDVWIMASSPARRDELLHSIGDEKTIHVAGTAATFPLLRSLISDTSADLAVIDLPTGVESNTTRDWLTNLMDLVTVLLLSPETELSIFNHMLNQKAGGMLSSHVSPEQLTHAIKSVASGLMIFDGSVLSQTLRGSTDETVADSLTPREIEVLGLLADGSGNREIAAALNVSEHTIKFHIRSILGKLGASSRTEAVTRGLRSGLIEL